MNAHDHLLAPLKREVDAHDYFAHNADLRMTAGDHAKHADNLRAIIAVLAAPKEAGDNPFAFDTLVAYGLANGANVVNGMPWSFKYMGLPVTHENDNHYLVNMPDGSTLNVYRCAPCPIDGLTEPHVGMDPPHQYLAAPQADQQGVEYDRELIADMLSEKVYDDGYGMKSHGAYTVEAIAEQTRALIPATGAHR